jgi:CIC family chloride channel protein
MIRGMDTVIRIGWVLVAGGTIGVATAGGTVGFIWILNFCYTHLLGSGDNHSGLRSGLAGLLLFTIPVIGGLLVGGLRARLPRGNIQGPADVVESVQTFRGEIPMSVGVRSVTASLVGLGVGASAGQYGPLVHLGATVGSAISRFMGQGAWVGSTGIACGVAAAISTAFTAPIAGILFAHEVVLRHFSLRAFAPVTVSAIVGYIIAGPILDQQPLLALSASVVGNIADYALFIVLGVVSAVLAVLFMRLMLWTERRSFEVPIPMALKPALAGIPVGLCLIWIPEVTGIGVETMRSALEGNIFGMGDLAVILIAKLVLTAVCVGFGLATGVFTPALVIGLLFGALVGQGLGIVFESGYSDLGIFAVCGAVAVASPVIGAPLSAILIVFELTRNYELTTAAMLSVVFANLVSYRIFGRSWFDRLLFNRGVDVSQGRDHLLLQSQSVGESMDSPLVTVLGSESLAEVLTQMDGQTRNLAWVVDSQHVLTGTLRYEAIRLLLIDQPDAADWPVSQAAVSTSAVLFPETDLATAMQQVANQSQDWIAVVEGAQHRRFLGVISRAKIVTTYQATRDRIREEEQASA